MKEQRKAIRKIWTKSFTSNKRRNAFVILAILLTTVLITAVISLGFSLLAANERQTVQFTGTVADGNVNNLTEEQYEKIKNYDELEAYGQQRTIGSVAEKSVKKKNVMLIIHWYDQTEWEGLREEAVTGLTGSFPVKENDVLVPYSALQALGIKNPKVGMSLPLEINTEGETQEKTFILSGYFKEYVTQRAPDISYLLVSDAFAEKYPDPQQRNTVSIKYKQGDVVEQNKKLADYLKLSEYQEIKTTLRESNQNGATVFIGIALFTLIILVSGGLLIYNVLYISIANDIRFYGLLKAIGTTGKQLRSIVIKQALLLSVVGISLGLFAGWLVSFWLVPFALRITNFSESVVVSTEPWIYIAAGSFALVTTLISSIKPAGIAAKVTPIQALRFVEAPNGLKKIRSKSGGKLYLMAWRNIFRDPKRALTVILSMFLGVTLFVAVNSAIDSMDFEKVVLNEMAHDVILSNNTSQSTSIVDGKGTSGKMVVAAIEKMDGVTDLTTYVDDDISVSYDEKLFSAYIESYNKYFKYGQHDPQKMTQENFRGKLVGIDSAEVAKLMTDTNATFDVEAFKNGAFGLVQSDQPSDFSTIKELAFTVLSTDQSWTLPINGFIANEYLEIQTDGAPVIFVAKEAIEVFTPYADMFSTTFNVSDEKKGAVINSQLKSLLEDQSHFKLITKEDMLTQAREEIMTIRLLGNTLAAVLALIGLLNFVNIITTSLIARKQELAILESIGMTRKQTNQVLAFEGFYYAGVTAVLVMTIGSLLTVGLFQLVKSTAPMAVFSFPFLSMTIILLVVVLICIMTPLVVMKFSGRQELADRIK